MWKGIYTEKEAVFYGLTKTPMTRSLQGSSKLTNAIE
jgi:hypothetical protein